MGAVTGSLGGALAAIAGRPRVEEGAEVHAGFTIDGLLPRWVVRPATLEQVSGVLALAWDAGLAVVPHGSGAAQELGVPPTKVDVVLDLRDLDRVVEYNPDDLTITVQAGVTLGTLESWLAARRQFLPLDPPGARARTLGGIAATGASGPLRLRYGTLRDLLLGVRFVQADGVVTWGGSKVVKSVSGYDVPKLMVGALGTLGVLAELTLRLHSRPDAESSWLVLLASPGEAQAFVERVIASPLQPSRIEIFNGEMLKLLSAGSSGAGVAVSIGSVAEAVREQGERLGAMAKIGRAQIAALPHEFWTAAESALTCPPGWTALHVVSLADRLADTVGAIENTARTTAPRAEVRLSGCAALGTLRVLLGGASVAEIAAITTRVRHRIAAIGGSAVVARGAAELR